jgi:hypothetical protein
MGLLSRIRARLASDPSTEENLEWLEASANPFGIDVIDCSPVTKTMVSTTADPNIAATYTRLRSSLGEEYRHRGQELENSVDCRLAYPCSEPLDDGPLFKSLEMEDKWDIYLYDSTLYFARSWTGDLGYCAEVTFVGGEMVVSRVRFAAGQDASFASRSVDFLIKSHVFGVQVPHPLPPDLETDSMTIAMFSFSSFGRRCAYGSYDDTTSILLSDLERTD